MDSLGDRDVVQVVEALARTLVDDPVLRVPQLIYYDHDTDTYAAERPSSTGPPKSFEIDFVLDETEPPISRRVSSKLSPGVEIPFDDGV